MKRLLITAAIMVLAGTAHARTDHYACKSNDDERYALTVNTDKKVVKLALHGPPFTRATFRILKGTSSDCKYLWTLSDGASICTATQGVARFDWNGREFECDLAETE